MDRGDSSAGQKMDADSVYLLLLVHLSFEFDSYRQERDLGIHYIQPCSFYNGAPMTGDPSLTAWPDLTIVGKASYSCD